MPYQFDDELNPINFDFAQVPNEQEINANALNQQIADTQRARGLANQGAFYQRLAGGLNVIGSALGGRQADVSPYEQMAKEIQQVPAQMEESKNLVRNYLVQKYKLDQEAKKEAVKTALELSKQAEAQKIGQQEIGLKQQELELKRKELETKQFPSAQYLAGGYARRVEQAEQVFDKLSEGGYNRAESKARIESFLPTEFLSDARKANDQAERNFINAILRRESGAAISEQEFKNAENQYFPRPGDDIDTIAQKKANRLQSMAALKAEAGKALEQIPLISTSELMKPGRQSQAPSLKRIYQDFRNKKTGQVITRFSDDGGKTWQQ
jgi:hypothetical protein